MSFSESSSNHVTTIAITVIPQSAPTDQPPWTARAMCKGRAKLFFAPRAERPEARYRREARARQICAVCAVSEECREYARTNHEYGFWGGESEEERHLAGYTLAAPVGIRGR